MKTKFVKFQLPVILWALFILFLCSTPGNKIPHISWLELLSFDKFVHASIFFILNFLSLRSISKPSKINFATATVFCVFYGGALEIMQSIFFYQRSGDLFDFIANSFGCIVAAFTYQALQKKLTTLFKQSY